MSNVYAALTKTALTTPGAVSHDEGNLRKRVTDAVYSSRSHKSVAEGQAGRQGLHFANTLFGLNKPTNNNGDALDVINAPVARLNHKSLSVVAQLEEQLGTNKYAMRAPIVRGEDQPVTQSVIKPLKLPPTQEAAPAATPAASLAKSSAPPQASAALPSPAAAPAASASPGSTVATAATDAKGPAGAPAGSAASGPMPVQPIRLGGINMANVLSPPMHAVVSKAKDLLAGATAAQPSPPPKAEPAGSMRGPVEREFRSSLSLEALAREHKGTLRHKINTLKEESFLQLEDSNLGALSAKFESGRAGVAAIGYDRVGGTSYGKYQLSSRAGTMRRFIGYLREHEPEWAERLAKSGRANTRCRRGAMPNTWREIAKENPQRFERLQEDFILRTNYHPARKAILEATNVDMASHSFILQDVLHSTAVQHGPGGASRIFIKAMQRAKAMDDNLDIAKEQRLIEEIYNTRKQNFGSSSRKVRMAVRNRLTEEMGIAIDMLQRRVMVADKDA